MKEGEKGHCIFANNLTPSHVYAQLTRIPPPPQHIFILTYIHTHIHFAFTVSALHKARTEAGYIITSKWTNSVGQTGGPSFSSIATTNVFQLQAVALLVNEGKEIDPDPYHRSGSRLGRVVRASCDKR